MLEELLSLRNEVIENREKLRVLNHQYNELLIKKHTNSDGSSKCDKTKYNKGLSIMKLVNAVISLTVGFLVAFQVISIAILFLYIPLSTIAFATFETFALPKIVFGRNYKVLKSAKKEPFDQKSADELYEQMSNVRLEYHRLRHEFEEKVSELHLEDDPEYQEYLKIVDNIIEEYESKVTPDNDACIEEQSVRELNLQ